jgi:hypothetical protein
MVKTLLGRTRSLTSNLNDTDNFQLYVISESFEKMHRRMTKPFSVTYYDCIQKLKEKNFAFTSVTLEGRDRGRDRECDQSLAFRVINAIPHLAGFVETKIPNLLHAANLPDPIYNERTYMEFHPSPGWCPSSFLCRVPQSSTTNLEVRHFLVPRARLRPFLFLFFLRPSFFSRVSR